MSDPKNIYLGISIFINIIGCGLLFFKSALNDILKDWWINRRIKKEEATKRLINFKTKFNMKFSQDLNVVLCVAIVRTDIKKNRDTDQTTKNLEQDSMQKSAKARNEIAEFLDYLPVDLINHYNRYDNEMNEIIKKILEDKVSKEDVLKYLSLIRSFGTETITAVDLILRKKFS